MDNPTQHLIRKSLRLLLAAAVAAVLLLFLAVPILFLLCGGVAAAIGGLAIIGLFTILQLPLFLLLMRFGLLPQPQCNDLEPVVPGTHFPD